MRRMPVLLLVGALLGPRAARAQTPPGAAGGECEPEAQHGPLPTLETSLVAAQSGSCDTVRVEDHGRLVTVNAAVWFEAHGVAYTPHLVYAPGVRAQLPPAEPEYYQPEAGEYAEAIRAGETGPLYIADVGAPVGWGVFAADDIAKGGLIGEYTGVVDLRHDGQNNEYLMYYTLENSPSEPNRLQSFNIDAAKTGNITRYVNHSYHPNARIQGVVLDGVKHQLLVAIEPIPKGEQVLFDYGHGYWGARGIEPIELRDPVPLPYRTRASASPPSAPTSNWELVAGNWIGSVEPDAAQQALAAKVVALARERDAGIVPDTRSWVQLSGDTKLRPDVAIYAKEHPPVDGEAVSPPVVVEILSPGSARMDLVWKKKQYEEAGVLEYWVLDPLQQTLTEFERGSSEHAFHRKGVYTPADTDLRLPRVGPVDLASLFQ